MVWTSIYLCIKLIFFQYFLKLESLVDRVRKLPCNPVSFREFINKLHALSFKYFYNFKSCKKISSIFTKADVNALKLLSTDKSIIVCKPDKGRGVVIVDKDVYVSKMCNIIADRSKFTPVFDPIDSYTRKMEDKVNIFLRKIKDCFSENYKFFTASGSAPGILYGLPKVHKVNFSTKFQFRPIFAAYSNPCFKLAKFLVSHLSHFTRSDYTTDNSYSFVTSVKQFDNIANNLYMTSFDIESLYTNIPLIETIEIILSQLFSNFFRTVT